MFKNTRKVLLSQKCHSVCLLEKSQKGVADKKDSYLEGEVEAAQPVAGEGVCAALEHDGGGLVELHDAGHDGDKQALVGLVVDAIPAEVGF